MAAEDHLQSRQMGMIAEAVRRHASKEAGIAPDSPEAPQVTGIRPSDPSRDRYTPEASHHVTVTNETPTTTHRRIYGVNTENEYMHLHTHVHEAKTGASVTGRPNTTTRFTPG